MSLCARCALLVPLVSVLACGDSENGETADSHADHGSHTGVETVETTAGQSAGQELCSCLLSSCHDPFHDKYGMDDMEAIAACVAEAEALPENGSPTEMGNFIECRQHFCDEAASDPSVCANALGDAVCI